MVLVNLVVKFSIPLSSFFLNVIIPTWFAVFLNYFFQPTILFCFIWNILIRNSIDLSFLWNCLIETNRCYSIMNTILLISSSSYSFYCRRGHVKTGKKRRPPAFTSKMLKTSGLIANFVRIGLFLINILMVYFTDIIRFMNDIFLCPLITVL